MNKFDTVFNKLMCECKEQKIIKEDSDIEAAYSEKIKELFTSILSDEACDLAEIQFKDDAEKQSYIDNVINTCIDDIEEHVEGEFSPEEFMMLADDVKRERVKEAIADNSEAIFGKDIFA